MVVETDWTAKVMVVVVVVASAAAAVGGTIAVALVY